MRSSPDSPKTWSSASPPVRTSSSAPPNKKSIPPLPSSVSVPDWPKSMSPPDPPVSESLPAPPNRSALGSAPLDSSKVILSLPACPNTLINAVLATVGVPPRTVTAPPFTRMLPAALRLIVIVLGSASPKTVNWPDDGLKLAVTAGVRRVSRHSKPGRKRAGRIDRFGRLPPRRPKSARNICNLEIMGEWGLRSTRTTADNVAARTARWNLLKSARADAVLLVPYNFPGTNIPGSKWSIRTAAVGGQKS